MSDTRLAAEKSRVRLRVQVAGLTPGKNMPASGPWKYISPQIGHLPLERVNAAHVEQVLSAVPGSAGTRHRVLATPRAALNAVVVSVAVLIHDFSDGLNTVSVVVKNGGDRKTALRWLLADAIAPILGALSSLAFSLPDGMIAVVLAFFAGFFLYIGASDLLPESHHAHPRFFTTVATFAGAATLWGVTQIAG